MLKQDINRIINGLGKNLDLLKEKKIFIPGGMGFLGKYFLYFFDTCTTHPSLE